MAADTSFHFGIGMVAGTALILPFLLRAWVDAQPLAPRFLQWFIASYGLGFFALIPALLRRLGASEQLVSHPVMNIFLLHPYINQVKSGGLIRGGAMVIGIAGLQYLLILIALRVYARRSLTRYPSMSSH